jgi:lauroyl/myristoyl acyltransferase
MLLRLGLELADRIARALPARVAYWLAALAGRAWHRGAPARRRLVAANLRRVCAATGRPTRGRSFEALVRSAFEHHARYYLEVLRAPHYDPRRIDRIVRAERWTERWVPLLRGGCVVATPHLGNFEPYSWLLASHGLKAVAPIEQIRPAALFEFLLARRAASGGSVEVVPLAKSRRRLIEALRAGHIAGLVADRDLSGNGVPVTLFGHPTSLPSGPAMLALVADRPLMVAKCLRVGAERFEADGWVVDRPADLAGNRGAAIAAMTAEMGRRFEEAIGEAPDQWWGAFQPIWPDLRR